MTVGGGLTELRKPKKIYKPEILDPKKYLASKFPTQKNTRLKYLNTDLFNQAELSNAMFCISKLNSFSGTHIAEKKLE